MFRLAKRKLGRIDLCVQIPGGGEEVVGSVKKVDQDLGGAQLQDNLEYRFYLNIRCLKLQEWSYTG